MLFINSIIKGDCLKRLQIIENNSIDSIVTDPPYELGFMGKSWDSTGIANNVELWKECLRVLKPGGHLLAFSGTRTYHRMASAIEDAGFEVRDMIEWVYGSGFPKSLNIAKAIDKMEGVEHPKNIPISDNSSMSGSNYSRNKIDVQSELAKQWEGWGTALKPAHEPICMARKPLAEKTVAENCLKWGTGGINIDESRVESNEELGRNNNARTEGTSFVVQKETMRIDNSNGKRFPANIIHDNSEKVRECFPYSKSTDSIRKNNQSKNTGAKNGANCYGKFNDCDTTGYSDSGNASRFFKSIIYQAKASKSERTAQGTIKNSHPTIKPIALMEYLIKMITPKGGIVLDPFAGSGTTLVAAKQNRFQYIGIEMTEEYIPIIEARLNAVK